MPVFPCTPHTYPSSAHLPSTARIHTPTQVPIGLEGEHKGVVDVVEGKAYLFEGERGENVRALCMWVHAVGGIGEKMSTRVRLCYHSRQSPTLHHIHTFNITTKHNLSQ